MTHTLAGLPRFLEYLSTFPAPDRLAESLVRGPLAAVDADTLMIWEVESGVMRLIGCHGNDQEERARYGRVPLTLDMPITLAVREGRTRIDPATGIPEQAIGGLDRMIISELIERTGAVVFAGTPIRHGSMTVGALSFGMSRDWDPHGPGPVLIDAIQAALAQWMTHPAAQQTFPRVRAQQVWSLDFTTRQRSILKCVEAGLTTSAIAAALETSEPTVKAGLQHAMKALRTSDRHEAARRARSLNLL